MGSKTSKASDASYDWPKSLHDQLMKDDGVSLHDCDSECKSYPNEVKINKEGLIFMFLPNHFLIINHIIM